VLLGGTAHFSLQTTHLTWDKAEALEGIFRGAYNRKFGIPSSAAAARLYAPRGLKCKAARTHLWAIGLAAALYATVHECISEPVDSQQRRAARSAVAMSLARWGCREDPVNFDWLHLRESLEHALRTDGVKYLGDAWMLGALIADDRAGSSGLRGYNGGTARWVIELELDHNDPLHHARPHFRPCQSEMVFQGGRRGVGLEPQPGLMEHGVLAVGHFCTTTRAGESAWISSYANATVKWGLPDSFELRLEWDHTMYALRRRRSPVAQERPLGLAAGWEDADDVAERAAELRGRKPAFEECLRKAVHERDAGLQGEATGDDVAGWTESLRRGLGAGAPRPRPSIRVTGVPDSQRRAEGPRIVFDDGGYDVRTLGGEQRWCARADVGEDGWLVGWREARDAAVRGLTFDASGRIVRDDGSPLSVAEAEQRSPALQLAVTAREALGDDVEVRFEEQHEKVHVKGVSVGGFGRAVTSMVTGARRRRPAHAGRGAGVGAARCAPGRSRRALGPAASARGGRVRPHPAQMELGKMRAGRGCGCPRAVLELRPRDRRRLLRRACPSRRAARRGAAQRHRARLRPRARAGRERRGGCSCAPLRLAVKAVTNAPTEPRAPWA